MAGYINLNKENFEETIKDGVVLVDFWAPWCGPCRMLGPIIEELAEEFEGKVKVCKVNVDENSEISEKVVIKAIPTIHFYKNGELVETSIGADTKDNLKKIMNNLL